jgi:hypothetical protein
MEVSSDAKMQKVINCNILEGGNGLVLIKKTSLHAYVYCMKKRRATLDPKQPKRWAESS